MCMVLVAMFWIEMFYLYGRGGWSLKRKYIDDQSWRIVMPALVCFAVVSIFEIVYVSVLHWLLNEFCQQSIHGEQDCSSYFGQDKYFYLTFKYTPIATVLLWLSATAIMLARIILAPDFKVVLIKSSMMKSALRKPLETTDDLMVECNSKEKLIFLNSEFNYRRSIKM